MTKRSGTSSEPPPEPLTYFIDRDLGIHDVPAALRAEGAIVELHRDHFPDDAEDVEWISFAAERGWVILTQDRNIQRRPHERAAVIAAGARYFCVSGGARRSEETAAMVAVQFRWIDGLARAMDPPIVARVTKSGVRFWDAAESGWVFVRLKHLRRQRRRKRRSPWHQS